MYGCCNEPSNSMRVSLSTLFGESDGETSSRATQSAGNGINVIKRSVRTVVSFSKNQFLFGRHPISSKCAIISYRPADFSVHSWHEMYDRSRLARSRGVRSAAVIPASNAEYWNFKLFLVFNVYGGNVKRKKERERKRKNQTRARKKRKTNKFNQIFKFYFDGLLCLLTNL